MKLTNKQLQVFADKLSKHLSECKENWISENEFIKYEADENFNFIDVVNGNYRLMTTCRVQYTSEISYCILGIDDFDVLYKYRNKLNQLDIYITDGIIKVRAIGQITLNNL